MGRPACKVCGKCKCKRWSHRPAPQPLCWPPSPSHVHRAVSVKGILLPADSDEPRLVDVDCAVWNGHHDRRPGDRSIWYPDTIPFLGVALGHPQINIEPVIWGEVKGRHPYNLRMGSPFVIISREDTWLRRARVNRCISALTGVSAHRWSGDVLVLKGHRDSLPLNGVFVDASGEDLLVIWEHLMLFGKSECGTERKGLAKFVWIIALGCALVALLGRMIA